MANYKSDIVAAVDSGDHMAALHVAGQAKTSSCLITLVAATTTNDTVQVCRVPVDARLVAVTMWSTDSGSTGTLDIGFHQVGKNNTIGTVIDQDAIGTAIDINTAALAGVNQRYETLTTATANQPIWQLAGLTARPLYDEVYLTATYSAGGDATTGRLLFHVTTI